MKVGKTSKSINPTPWWQPPREVAAARVVEAGVAKAKVVVEKLVFVIILEIMAIVNLGINANFHIRLAALLMEQPLQLQPMQ